MAEVEKTLLAVHVALGRDPARRVHRGPNARHLVCRPLLIRAADVLPLHRERDRIFRVDPELSRGNAGARDGKDGGRSGVVLVVVVVG